MPIEQKTNRLQMPLPYLTNPLKIDVGRLTDAINMIDANAVMLNDWDITVGGWQKMCTINGLEQGRVSISLMVVTGNGFANVIFKTGDGTVTTVNAAGRLALSAQTNLGLNIPTILDGKAVEVSDGNYEVWFNIDPATPPMKWTGLLIAGNGATIDWTSGAGTAPTTGFNMPIARSLTDNEIASDTVTKLGSVVTTGFMNLGAIAMATYAFAGGDKLTTRTWKVGEVIRVVTADATTANGFPAAIPTGGSTAWNIRCETISADRNFKIFEFIPEGFIAPPVYRIQMVAGSWSATVSKVFTSDAPPTAAQTGAIPVIAAFTGTVNLNSRILPAHLGVMAITNAATATVANNFPYTEAGQLFVFPYGSTAGVTQLYISVSGRVAARNYDGSVFTDWRRGAMAGANNDITSLTALTGPLTLGGDGSGDYDAVTLRQLRASSGGSGATMNGVMNNFIGCVEWFGGSRAALPSGYIAADGQILNRVDYPDLWAAIKSGMLNSATEAQWSAASAGRANYSRGDGDLTTGTTFRTPDLNGKQNGSIKSLFLRGDGGTEPGGAGSVRASSAPNITGSLSARTAVAWQGGTGMVSLGTATAAGVANATDTTNGTVVNFDASKSNDAYGRDATTEVRPNSAVGIWVIRASGLFTAANTNFHVINSDATAPGNNTVANGGDIVSDYKITDTGGDTYTALFRAQKTIGGLMAGVIQVQDGTAGTPYKFQFASTGQFMARDVTALGDGTRSGILRLTNKDNSQQMTIGVNDSVTTEVIVNRGAGISSLNFNGTILTGASYVEMPGTIAARLSADPASPAIGAIINSPEIRTQFRTRGNWNDGGVTVPAAYFSMYTQEKVGTIAAGILQFNGYSSKHAWYFNQTGSANGDGAWGTTSDIRVKDNLELVPNALAAVYSWRGVTYDKKDVGREVGLIAQDVIKDCPDAITDKSDKTLSDGTVIKDCLTLNVAGVSAAYHTEAIKSLVNLLALALDNPEEARKQIAALKA